LFGFNPIKGLWAAVTAVAFYSCASPSEKSRVETSGLRIVTLSPTLTEMVYALGDTVVGRDLLSTLPETALRAPSVGYMRSLSDEGILSLSPTHVFLTTEAGPDAVIEKIAAAGVVMTRFPRPLNVDSSVKTIEILARILHKADKGKEIIAGLRAKTDSAARLVSRLRTKPKILYFNSRGDASNLFAHGKQTVADFYITGGGGVNAVDFDEIKPLSPESLLAANPDILLFDKDTFDRLGGLDGLANSAVFSKLKAVEQKRVVVAPTAHFFGVGPHAGDLLLNFHKAFHP
jgi:iron complex transport system substrate-binding protein